MKKTLFSLIALISVAFGASAMSLKDAYKALSNIPNVSVTKPDYNLPMDLPLVQQGQFEVKEGNLAAGYNLNAAQIKETGDAAFTLINQVPMQWMINGSNNGYVAGFVYAQPTGNGLNDVLIVTMSGYLGDCVALYAENVPDNICSALQMAPLTMEGNYLSIEAKWGDNDGLNIMQTKAR